MAVRYCVHGATNNGDGTTSAEAGSPGGVGAYNDFIECLKNTASYTVSAGDQCYVKSSPAGAGGGDLTINTSASVAVQAGSSAADSGTRRWYIDDGTVWAQSGSLIINEPNSNAPVSIGSYNAIHAPKDKLVFQSAYTGANTYNIISIGTSVYVYMTGVLIKYGVSSTTYCRMRAILISDAVLECGSLTVELHAPAFSSVYPILDVSFNTLVIQDFTLDAKVASTPARVFFGGSTSGRASTLDIWGGEIKGEIGDDDRLLTSSSYVSATISNFKTPFIENLLSSNEATHVYLSNIRASLSNDGMDFIESGTTGYISWDHTDGNYPTGNAILGDGADTPWSILYKPTVSSSRSPLRILNTSKLWNGVEGQVQVDVELLVRNTMTNVDDGHFWIMVQYENSSNVIVTEDTRTTPLNGAALTTGSGTGLWSSLSYGAQTMLSKKITLTTSGDVLSDSVISIKAYCSQAAPDSTTVGFIDPDPTLTAV